MTPLEHSPPEWVYKAALSLLTAILMGFLGLLIYLGDAKLESIEKAVQKAFTEVKGELKDHSERLRALETGQAARKERDELWDKAFKQWQEAPDCN